MPAELAFALAAIQEGSRVGERRQVPGMEAGRSEAYLRFLPCQMVQGFPLLQMEMGHRSSTLLRARYLNMEGVSREGAALFWEVPEKEELHG